MERDNIKHFAIAAFRHYAHNKDSPVNSAEDIIAIAAVASTLRHLQIDHRQITVDVIRLVCFGLPSGDLPRGTITLCVMDAADELNTSYSCVWRELRRACDVFNSYYSVFTSKS